jgi:voltage-gated potassium channel
VSAIGGRERSEQERDAWLEELTERADPFMAWLGVVFALLVGFEIAVKVSPGTARALELAGWTIWAAFLLEFLARLWLAPRRGRYVRRHWFQLLALAVPTLRVLRFVRLLRLGRALPAARVVSSSYRSVGTARRLFRSRLGYLGATAVVVAVAVAELAFLFERSHEDGVFSSFGDALLWSFAAVLALQGDPTPASVGARIVMLCGFVFGLVVVAALAGTVGAYLVEERRERAEREAHTGGAGPA